MSGRRHRVGVLGSFVWDTIHALGSTEPSEQIGGLAYSLAAWSAALLGHWEIVPLIRVGHDIRAEAEAFLGSLPGVAADAKLDIVPQENCRVSLRYNDDAERDESLSGTVVPWTAPELTARIRDLDALYINHMTGLEMDLATAEAVRRNFSGPIYADLHALFLDEPGDRVRQPRTLPEASCWIATADVLQVNETELDLLERSRHSDVGNWVGRSPLAMLTTLGPRGANYLAPEPLPKIGIWADLRFGAIPLPDAVSRHVPLTAGPRTGDPTGCGDIWGSVTFAGLLNGLSLPEAMGRGNAAASARLASSGMNSLRDDLASALSAWTPDA